MQRENIQDILRSCAPKIDDALLRLLTEKLEQQPDDQMLADICSKITGYEKAGLLVDIKR